MKPQGESNLCTPIITGNSEGVLDNCRKDNFVGYLAHSAEPERKYERSILLRHLWGSVQRGQTLSM